MYIISLQNKKFQAVWGYWYLPFWCFTFKNIPRPILRAWNNFRNVSASHISVYLKNCIFFLNGALSMADTVRQPQPWWRLRTPYGTLGVATIPWLQPPRHSEAGAPLPAAGREATKGAVTPVPSHPPSRPDFHSFQNHGNGMCKFHNYYANRANRCIPPCSWSEN